MTRETKIGLLVGLAFIIVIGILLSDHFRGSQEPPPATLERAGAVVRQTVAAPGINQTVPPITMAPDQVSPRTTVPTPRDMEPPTSPIVMKTPETPAPVPANDPLAQVAKAQGEEFIAAPGSPTTPQPIAVATHTYKAQSGDTVSRMAAKFLGANTYKNRQAIIQANPSLMANPNKIVVDQDYTIPATTNAAAIPGTVAIAPAADTTSTPYVYIVKEGDTLWGIATGQLGKPGAVEAIKELNQTALHGSNSLRPGMKLRLPSQPVAIAD